MKMNSKITNVLFFAAGAAIGSVATWKILKNRYERIVQEEIDSVKNAFNELVAIRPDQETEETTDEEEGDPNSLSGAAGKIDWSKLEDLDENEDDEYDYEPNEEDIAEYEQLTASYSNEKGGVNKVNKKEPYIIDPYSFGEEDGYHTVELTYYADDVLEDDSYCIVTDRDELIGPKALYTFGEYEDDAVFVRNEHLRTDFQILKDYRTYAEARSIGPNRVADE